MIRHAFPTKSEFRFYAKFGIHTLNTRPMNGFAGSEQKNAPQNGPSNVGSESGLSYPDMSLGRTNHVSALCTCIRSV